MNRLPGRWVALSASALLIASAAPRPAMAAPAPMPKRTLVLCASARVAYGLGHELEFLKLQLNRANTQVDSLPIAEVTPERLMEATHVVVLCPEPTAILTTNLAQQLRAAQRPLLWLGHGLAESEAAPLLVGPVTPQNGLPFALSNVTYRAKEWDVGQAGWVPIQASDDPGTQKVMTLPGLAPAGKATMTLCWRHGLVTVFSAVPRSGLLGLLFADLLLDFYEMTSPAPCRLLLRLDDYQANSDHFEFESKVDLLAARRVP